MIHIFGGMWVGSLIVSFAQNDAHWATYLILGVTALMFYAMGHHDGAN